MKCEHGNEIYQSVNAPKCEMCHEESTKRIEDAIQKLRDDPKFCRRITASL
jgi:hypothetical protein